MPLPDEIAAIRADNSRDERRKTLDIYAVKTGALIDVIVNGKPAPGLIHPMQGRTITHKGFTFCINSAEATPEHSLKLDVTFARPPANPVTHQITITNPPVLPAAETRSGNEKQDLIQAISEMLEGFV